MIIQAQSPKITTQTLAFRMGKSLNNEGAERQSAQRFEPRGIPAHVRLQHHEARQMELCAREMVSLLSHSRISRTVFREPSMRHCALGHSLASLHDTGVNGLGGAFDPYLCSQYGCGNVALPP